MTVEHEHFELNRTEYVKNYVCTFEQAERLYNFGIKPKENRPSLFYWSVIKYGDVKDKRRMERRSPLNEWCEYKIEAHYLHDKVIGTNFYAYYKRECKVYSAFTSQELIEIITEIDEYALENYFDDYVYVHGSNEAEARAEFLIQYLEQINTPEE